MLPGAAGGRLGPGTKAEARAAIDAETPHSKRHSRRVIGKRISLAAIDAETPLLRDRERREGREAGAEAGKEALQAGPVDRRGGAGNLL